MNYRKYFPQLFSSWIEENAKDATDITLVSGKEMFISEYGKLKKSGCMVTKSILNEIAERMCSGSIYANQHTLKNGYFKLPDGIRVGVTGEIITDENGLITHMRDISSLNIRVSRYIKGAAKEIIPHVINNSEIYNTLIIGPPSSGKTTILRDMIAFFGNRFRSGIADERGELSEGFDTGSFTFSICGGSKHEMMVMLQRSMSPDVIFTDEIGTKDDEDAIRRVVNGGVKIICTAHGYSVEDLTRKDILNELITNRVFERIVVLSKRCGTGTVEKIIYAEDGYD